ncbi:aminoglycoside phosphotransferase family protein [Legionella impletisoli]|uniref:Phosphotransferase n=1 Tax=Legionella impletisoli TaxID=343510 RepID=A0A917NFN5_9GAMM|nr:phosphotransferase [Legionella impletisoli]GGI93388.1 phosphotransferase [Legionella impletisoli]
MHNRQYALNDWLKKNYAHAFNLTPLTGDASFRSYYRMSINQQTFIVMDAPPEKEPLEPFIQVNHILQQLGAHAPQIYASDIEQGFLVLEDFGDQLLLTALTIHNADALYKVAMGEILKMQQTIPQKVNLSKFDKSFMLLQMDLFREWFLHRYLGLEIYPEHELLMQKTFCWIADTIEKQPYVLTHFDFHSRNLMLIPNETPAKLGVIDFQDAMFGPFTYDLVSLLKDCYIQWPREQTLCWIRYFYNHLPQTDIGSFEEFVRGFDVCGLQRHLKVLGIFSRLHLRDNKPGYLKHLPLTLNYFNDCLETYDELKPFYQFAKDVVYPAFKEKHPV